MRYVIAAGTGRYQEGSGLPDLDLALQDVAKVAEFFTAPDMGYTRVLTKVSTDPVAAEFEDALSEWCLSGVLADDDVVVVYYAGHGDRPTPGGPYRLACTDSRDGRPRSWLSPHNVAEILAASPVRNVLFIIDSCYAAVGSVEFQSVTESIVSARPRGDGYGSGTWVLASARHRDYADDGAFVTRLIEVCARGDGPSQRYLPPTVVATKVSQALAADGRRQRAACSSTHQTEEPPFFPNPGYDPGAEVDDCSAAGDTADLFSHFEPRGRGVEHVHDPGSYFTGRESALAVLRAYLTASGGGGALVVTAAPGSGKSAVLGKLVLEGHSDVSVNARHQTLETLVARLAAAADIRATSPAALLKALSYRQAPFRVVIDSIDEAGPAGDKVEARRIAWDLLRPLADVPCVRLVIGSRRELLSHFGEHLSSIDLDSPQYAGDTSTAEYVREILMAAKSPYADRPTEAKAVAGEVSRRAGRCFLVARMTASALLRGEPVDTSVPGWAETLPSDVGGAFEAYLRRLPQARYEAAMALLTALAFGEGQGLSRRVWLMAATSLSGVALREKDVDVLVEEDESYLTCVNAAGAKHFRLYHQELTDYLRQRVLKIRDLRDVHDRFVEVLIRLTPGRDWGRALQYVREHLSTHAAAAGVIQGLVEDPAFVLAANPAGLLPAVRHPSCDPVLAMVVERCADILGPLAPPGIDRAARLAFTAESHGAAEFARRAEELSASVKRVRVEARPVTPHRIVGRHEEGTYSTVSGMGGWSIDDSVLVDGTRVVLAAAGRRPDVHVWMIDDPSRSGMLRHPVDVTHVRVLSTEPGLALAVTLDAESDLRIWELSDQTVVRHLPGTGYKAILDVGRLQDGTPVVVCRDQEHVVLLDAAGKPLVQVPCASPGERKPMNAATAAVVRCEDDTTRLVVCDPERGTVAAYASEDAWKRTLLLEDLARPGLFGRRLPDAPWLAVWEHDMGPNSLGRISVLNCVTGRVFTTNRRIRHAPWGGFVRRGSTDIVFVANEFQNIHTYSAESGYSCTSSRSHGVGALFTPLTPYRDGRLYAIDAHFDGGLSFVDCATGAPVGQTLRGHESAVGGLHVLTSPEVDSYDLLTVGNDGTARLWHLRHGDEERATRGEEFRESEFDKTTTVHINGWSARSHEFIVGSWPGLRLIDGGALDQDDSMHLPLVARHLHNTTFPDQGSYAEENDGTMHVLSKNEEIVNTPGESSSKAIFRWQRIRPDGTVASTDPDIFTMVPWDVTCHLLPPTAAHAHPRLIGFDPLNGRLLSATSQTTEEVESPWSFDTRSMKVCTAGFTDRAGHAVLLMGARESVVAGDFTGGSFAASDGENSGTSTRAYFWDATARRPLRNKPKELPARLTSLLAHHDDSGTRYIAMACADERAAVVDLDTNSTHLVSTARSVNRRRYSSRNLTNGDGYFLRWADTRQGDPLLVYMPLTGDDDTFFNRVVVWDSSRPGALARELTTRARRLLWTGFSPSGDTLLATSDEHGISLYRLPDGEKVWATPIPALVTALAALPNSPHLDLGVATQQGVVLLRPKFTSFWQRQLLVSP
ncbi:NACHT and WD repeat domain-containing protein [Streptomyces sp. NBC_01242]|uniref:caspase family protein n=1 Tax=Streptomyces sp. NBC_01242 TaxID=2903795 RepID=UPI0022552C32|nr:caspase family protein [Streptomyces sp. NBC_01242]MCX4797642.1 NACHT and WD repeat domain-containing protein [Streptomyces sp. NBC_01242]